MKSWTNKVFFFSSNSISFILLTRANFLYIHTGNELEEVLEGQETREERKKIIGNENIVDETMVVDFYLYLPGCESLL